MKTNLSLADIYALLVCSGIEMDQGEKCHTHGSSSRQSHHHSHPSHHTASGWEHSGGCHIGNLPEDRRSPPLLEGQSQKEAD